MPRSRIDADLTQERERERERERDVKMSRPIPSHSLSNFSSRSPWKMNNLLYDNMKVKNIVTYMWNIMQKIVENKKLKREKSGQQLIKKSKNFTKKK